jgi:hypothetical protein
MPLGGWIFRQTGHQWQQFLGWAGSPQMLRPLPGADCMHV